MGKYLLYYVYDIDKNGVRELIVQTGTCEADYMYEIYTIQTVKQYISVRLQEDTLLFRR